MLASFPLPSHQSLHRSCLTQQERVNLEWPDHAAGGASSPKVKLQLSDNH